MGGTSRRCAESRSTLNTNVSEILASAPPSDAPLATWAAWCRSLTNPQYVDLAHEYDRVLDRHPSEVRDKIEAAMRGLPGSMMRVLVLRAVNEGAGRR